VELLTKYFVDRFNVETALRRTRGNQSRAAALLHMTRDQIRHRMTKFDLVAPSTTWTPT
jgi:DNA-binding protein Fis